MVATAALVGIAGLIVQGPLGSDLGVGPAGTTSSPVTSGPVYPLDPAPLPVELRSEWVADVNSIPALGNADRRIRLFVSNDGGLLWIRTNTVGNTVLHGVSVRASPGEVSFVTDRPDVGCLVGDVGRYRWSASDDGVQLVLEVVSDDCDARAKALSRIWTRAVDGVGRGGRGVVAAFDPPLLVTLPAGVYASDVGTDSAEIRSLDPENTFLAVKDPWGLAEPCQSRAGNPTSDKTPLEPSIAAFTDYLQRLPGTTVTSSSLEIDGHPAAHLIVTVDPTAGCPSGPPPAFAVKAFTSDKTWSFRVGEPNSVYLVEVGSDLYLLAWEGPGVSAADEQQVMASIGFLDSLRPEP